MMAASFSEYGSIDTLAIKDVPRPEPKENEVLIKNYYSSINFGNWGHVKGEPYFIRMFTGFGKPKYHIPGGDISGVIEAVGSQVTEFKPGDNVIADSADSGFGAFAEYVVAPENVVVPKPDNLSYAESATLPLAACVAYQALHGKAGIKSGQRILLVGSTGSVGTFALLIAKAFGAEVTAVCSGKHADYVKMHGADHIIDYTTDDFTKRNTYYDAVVGIAGTRPMKDYKKVLTPTGTFINVGGSMKQFIDAITTGPLLYMFSKQKFIMVMYKANKRDLLAIAKLAEDGKLKPVITKSYPLSRIVEAFKYYEAGKAAGKIVISIS